MYCLDEVPIFMTLGEEVPNSTTIRGQISEGQTSEGHTTKGQITEGQTTRDQTTKGLISEGQNTGGQTTEVKPSRGLINEFYATFNPQEDSTEATTSKNIKHATAFTSTIVTGYKTTVSQRVPSRANCNYL